MSNKLYLAVTPDEYELPLFVADSAVELAKMFSTTANVVSSCISHNSSGKKAGVKFIRIVVEED